MTRQTRVMTSQERGGSDLEGVEEAVQPDWLHGHSVCVDLVPTLDVESHVLNFWVSVQQLLDAVPVPPLAHDLQVLGKEYKSGMQMSNPDAPILT